MSPPPLAFYCVCNSDFFLGAVALVNSLRLLGHAEPIFVLDCGLSPAQRALLAERGDPGAGARATRRRICSRPWPHFAHPAEVMVLVDADIIVTRPLTGLIERASRGRVLAVEHGRDRFFGEWGELLGGTARHRPYVSSSLVLLGGELGGRVIRLMEELQGRIPLEGTPYAKPRWAGFSLEGGDFWDMAGEHPFFFADQDVLNAVLATEDRPGPSGSARPPPRGHRTLHRAQGGGRGGAPLRLRGRHRAPRPPPSDAGEALARADDPGRLHPASAAPVAAAAMSRSRSRSATFRSICSPALIAGAKRWYRGPLHGRRPRPSASASGGPAPQLESERVRIWCSRHAKLAASPRRSASTGPGSHRFADRGTRCRCPRPSSRIRAPRDRPCSAPARPPRR